MEFSASKPLGLSFGRFVTLAVSKGVISTGILAISTSGTGHIRSLHLLASVSSWPSFNPGRHSGPTLTSQVSVAFEKLPAPDANLAMSLRVLGLYSAFQSVENCSISRLHRMK